MEAIGTTAVLATLMAGVLFVTFVLFARAWLQYQSEQALYCVLEGTPSSACASLLQTRSARTLPFGRILIRELHGRADYAALKMEWIWNGYTVPFAKSIAIPNIARRRGMPSSAY